MTGNHISSSGCGPDCMLRIKNSNENKMAGVMNAIRAREVHGEEIVLQVRCSRSLYEL